MRVDGGIGAFRLIDRTVERIIRNVDNGIAWRPDMAHLTANDLKTKGVAAIEAMLEQHSEAIVSVRGKERFVVMDIAQYHYLRECELEAALAETRADLAAGRFVQESPEDHLARIKSAE
jgi:PHD/YefM family antitoxin component YafN of YafNO toxin-antitoxin module